MAFSLLPGYWESQLLLVVTLGLSGVVVNRTFTLRGVDVCTRLFVDHCCVNVFICVLNFLLTAKFSQSTVSSLSFINVLKPFTWLHISTANYVIMSYLCDSTRITIRSLTWKQHMLVYVYVTGSPCSRASPTPFRFIVKANWNKEAKWTSFCFPSCHPSAVECCIAPFVQAFKCP